MKLHVVLDSRTNIHSSSEDIVLVSASNSKLFSGTQITLDKGIINESQEIYFGINNWFKTLDTCYKSLKNRAYVKLFRPVLQTLSHIDALLRENNVSEIVLYDGSNYPFFIVIGGEGEGEKRNYKTNWLVNSFIYEKYKNDYKITWRNKKTWVLFAVYNFGRNAFQTVSLLIRESVRSLRSPKQVPIIFEEKCRNFVIVTDLLLQYEHLESIMRNLSDKDKTCKTYHFSFGKRVVEKGNNVNYIGGLKLKDIISLFFLRLPPMVSGKTFMLVPGQIPSSIKRGFRYMYRELMCREKRLIASLSDAGVSKECAIVTDMTAGHIIAIRDVAKEIGCYHYNIQHVSMSPVLYPDLNLADKFYIYADRTFNLYKQFSDSFSYYLPINKAPLKERDNNSILYAIFFQPDSYTQEYINYITSALPVINEKNKQGYDIKVIIKPHYRQDRIEDICAIALKYAFVNVASKTSTCAAIIEEADLCMSISSSVIFEAMTNSKPCLVYNPGHKYDYDVFEAGVCYPDVNYVVTSPEESVESICKITQLRKEFDRRLDSFVKKNCCQTDWDVMLRH